MGQRALKVRGQVPIIIQPLAKMGRQNPGGTQ